MSVALRILYLNKRAATRILLIAGLLLLCIHAAQSPGRVRSTGLLIGMVFAFVLTYRYPVPALLLLLWMYSGMPIQPRLPTFQIPGFRVTARDALLGMLFLVAVDRLIKRGERPVFLRPMLLLGAAIALSTVLGMVAGTADIRNGTNSFRALMPYFIYFVLVGVIDTRDKLGPVLGLTFFILAFSVGIQVGQALGLRLPGGWGTRLATDLGGRSIPYLWNRNAPNLLLSLFLASGCIMEGQRTKRYLPLALLGLLGFALAVVRQWFIFVGVGMVVMMSLYSGRRILRTGFVTALVGIVLVLSLGLISVFSLRQDVGSWLEIIWLRLMSTMNAPAEASFVGRIEIWQVQLELLRQAPVFGFGLGTVWNSVLSTDVGMVNSLLLVGIAGFPAVLWLIGAMAHHGLRLWRGLPPSVERGYAAGLLATLAAMVVGYAFSQDFFTFIPLIVAMVMALIDRLLALHPGPSTSDTEQATTR